MRQVICFVHLHCVDCNSFRSLIKLVFHIEEGNNKVGWMSDVSRDNIGVAKYHIVDFNKLEAKQWQMVSVLGCTAGSA